MDTYQFFFEKMIEKYTTGNLVTNTTIEFEKAIHDLQKISDGDMEGYQDSSKQRDLSVRYHWGHNHDFGSFKMEGRMQNRHLIIPASFIDRFQAFPLDLTGKRVLDIGVWTGGTSLLFAALGAKVVAIEEVKKYSDTVRFLKEAFGIKSLEVENLSLYELNQEKFFDQFDYVFFSGVIYHITDPVLALRILFNTLKDGGTCMVETYALEGEESLLRYEGASVFGAGNKEDLSRGGWNYFIPTRLAMQRMMEDVGFENVQVGDVENLRLIAVGTRTKHRDMLRAGLSVRNIR